MWIMEHTVGMEDIYKESILTPIILIGFPQRVFQWMPMSNA